MEQQSWSSNHGGEIMEEQSWRSNHGGAIMEQQSLRSNHGGEIMEEKSWRRTHVEGDVEGIWRQRHPGGTQEASRSHPGCTQEASRRHPGGTPEIFRRSPGRTQEISKRLPGPPGGTQRHPEASRRPEGADTRQGHSLRTKARGQPAGGGWSAETAGLT